MISSQSSDFTAFKEELEDQAFHNIYPPPSERLIRSKCQRPRKPKDQNETKTTFKGRPFYGTYENVINSPDGRKQVQSTDKWPYSVHGVIEGKFNNDTFRGTGIMIGPNIVLTAGHNLYYPEKKVYADLESIKFKPAINGKVLPFDEVKVEKYFVSPNFIKEEKEDYGVLLLKKPIGEVTGYFGIACLKTSKLIKKKVNITGYPEDKMESTSKTFEMWEMEGQVEEIDKEQGLISYKIDTGKGQSGSGIVYEENGEYFVCGVHVQRGQDVNIATFLTRSRYEQIYKWIKENVRKELPLYMRNSKNLRFWGLKVTPECLSWLLKEDLESLVSLNLRRSGIQTAGAFLLGQSTTMINLSQLDLSDNRISDEGIQALAQNTSWINLSKLSLHRNNIGDEGGRGLGQNTSWINLSELDLSENNIGDEGAKEIGQNAAWINLSKLDLSENNINDEGAKGLGQNISWINLSKLNLSNNWIRDEGAKGLGQNTSWINLRELNFLQNKIGGEGAKGLGQNISWTKLRRLDLYKNKIGDEGARALGQNLSWVRLSQLILAYNSIGDEGAQALAQNISWINLSELHLSNNKIRDEGAKGLGQNTAWTSLSELNLSNNEVLDEGAKRLGQNISWAQLRKLNLYNNDIGDKGVKGLAQNTTWVNLSELDLAYNHIGDEGAKALAKGTSRIQLSQLNLEGNRIGDKGAKAFAHTKIPKFNLAWNVMSYECIQTLPKNFFSFYHSSLFLDFACSQQIGLLITENQMFSISSALENSKTFDALRITFITYFQSFVKKMISSKEFLGFVLESTYVLHSGWDLNGSLPNPEEDDELIEESDFNYGPEISTFSCNQLCIEEGNSSTQTDSNLNFNSNNLSAEEVQFTFKNTFDHSS